MEPEAPRQSFVEKPSFRVARIKGSFTLDGNQAQDFGESTIASGSSLVARTAVRIDLTPERFLLLKPKTALTLRVAAEDLVLELEEGSLLAEMHGKGSAVTVVAGGLDIRHVGTVFLVTRTEKETLVATEDGVVECRSGKAVARVAAGRELAAPNGVPLPVPRALDPKRFEWARSHRPAEWKPYQETFDQKGRWQAKVESGAVSAVADPGVCAGKIRLESDETLFRVPMNGRLEIVYRSDRATSLTVDLYAAEKGFGFEHVVEIPKSAQWRRLTIDFDPEKWKGTEKGAGHSLAPSIAISEIYLMFGHAGESGTFMVDFIEVIAKRP